MPYFAYLLTLLAVIAVVLILRAHLVLGFSLLMLVVWMTRRAVRRKGGDRPQD